MYLRLFRIESLLPEILIVSNVGAINQISRTRILFKLFQNKVRRFHRNSSMYSQIKYGYSVVYVPSRHILKYFAKMLSKKIIQASLIKVSLLIESEGLRLKF